MQKKRVLIAFTITLAIVVSILFAKQHSDCVRHKGSIRLRMQDLTLWVNEPLGNQVLQPEYYGADGKTLYSWRLKLLSQMIPSPNRLAVDEPWNSVNNKAFSPIGVHAVSMSADGPPDIVMVVGRGTAFEASPQSSSHELREHLVLFVETAKAEHHWMDIGDLNLAAIASVANRNATMQELVGVPSCGIGFHAAFQNGRVLLLRSDIPAANFLPFCHTASSEKADFVGLIEPYSIR